MNCSTHPDLAAVAFCRACGKALCSDCRRSADGTVYCADHAPAPYSSVPGGGAPYAPGPAGPTHPKVAFALGFIPGVGAIYNGQYAKGLMHAVIFGLLVSILDSRSARGLGPLFGPLIGAFVLYMAFEAYHTARRRNRGEQVDEFSSILQSKPGHSSGGALALIAVGAIFLLNTLGVVELHQILRFWPVLLIALGVNMLYSRVSGSERRADEQNREVNHDRQ